FGMPFRQSYRPGPSRYPKSASIAQRWTRERPAQGGKENINFLYSLRVVRLLRQLRGITGLFRREYKIPCRLQIALAVRRVDRHSWVADMAQTPIYYLGNHRGNVMEPIYQTGVRDIAVDRWDKSEEYIV